MRRIRPYLKDSLLSLLETLSIVGSSLALTPLFIRVLGPSIFALYTLSLSIVGFLSLVSTALSVEIESEDIGCRRNLKGELLEKILGLNLLFASIMSCLCVLIIFHLATTWNIWNFDSAISIRDGIILIIGLASLSFFDQLDIVNAAILRSLGEHKASTLIDVSFRFLQLSIVAAALMYLRSFPSVVVSLIIFSALRGAARIIYLRYYAKMWLRPIIDFRYFKNNIHRLIMNICTLFTSSGGPLVERFIVSANCPPEQFTIYILALQAGSVCSIVGNGLVKWTLPLHNTMEVQLRKKGKSVFFEVTLPLTVIASLIGLLMAVLISIYVLKMSGMFGHQSVQFSIVAICASFLTTLTSGSHFYLLAIRRNLVNSVITTSASAASLCVTLLSVHTWGAMAALVSRFAYAIIVGVQNPFALYYALRLK